MQKTSERCNNDLPRHFRSRKLESKESRSIKEHLFEDTQYNSEMKDKIYFIHIVLLLRKSAGKHAIVFFFFALSDSMIIYAIHGKIVRLILQTYIINIERHILKRKILLKLCCITKCDKK